MTNPEILVDTIQHAKKQFIKEYIKQAELQWVWNDYVDTQTKFVKQSIKTMSTTFELAHEKIINMSPKQLMNPFKIDWYEAWWDSYVKNNLNKNDTI